MASPAKANVKFEWLPLSTLTFPAHAQRSLHKKARVEKIVNNFDPDALGAIEVSANGGTKFEVVDGWHRVLALRQMGWGDQKVPCLVHRGLTSQEEAGLFNKLNDETSVRYVDRFFVRVHAGEPGAVAVDGLIRSLGLVPSVQSRDGHVTALQAAERVYRGYTSSSKKENPEALRATLRILTGAWGKQQAALRGELIQGIGLVVIRHGKACDPNDLTNKLASYSGGPGSFVGTARAVAGMKGTQLAHSVASVAVDLYNKGRRAHRLPDWWAS